MYRIVLLVVLLIGITNCTPSKESSTQEEQAKTTTKQVVQETPQPTVTVDAQPKKPTERADLSFLLKLAGKYPYESKMFENEPMKGRLQAIMGDKFHAFVQRMEVQVPIKVNGNEVFMEGLMAHGGGTEEAALIVDVEKNLIWVLTYEDGKDLFIFKDDRDVRMPDTFIRKIQEFQ